MHIAKLICVLGFFWGGGGERRAHLIYESTKTWNLALNLLLMSCVVFSTRLPGSTRSLVAAAWRKEWVFLVITMEYRQANTFTIHIASRNISLARDRFFSEPAISKPLAGSWSLKEPSVPILNCFFFFSRTSVQSWDWFFGFLKALVSDIFTNFLSLSDA